MGKSFLVFSFYGIKDHELMMINTREMKKSRVYKENQARKILEIGEFGDCSKIPISTKIPRPTKKGDLDGATGISISGIQTNIAIPNLNVTLDAGRNADLILEDNLFISHFDGDHIEGLGRAICNSINRKSKLDVFLPPLNNHKPIKNAIDVFKKKDKNDLIKIHEIIPNKNVKIEDKNIMVEAFKVPHTEESIGLSLWKKVNGKWKRRLTYSGDFNPSEMNVNIPQFMNTDTLIVESSLTGFLLPLLDTLVDQISVHASSDEIESIAKKARNVKRIGIMHIPPLSCMEIETDLKNKLSDENEDIYYLRSCNAGLFDNPMMRMGKFKRINKN